jgi:signal transduction histidine kinase
MTGVRVQSRAARARATDLLHSLTEATSGLARGDFVRRLLRELTEQLPVAHAFVALINEQDAWLQVVAWSRSSGVRRETLEPSAGPELADILGDDAAANARNLREHFPDDPLFAAPGIESLFAVALTGSDGGYLGHLGVMSEAPAWPDEQQAAVLRLLAARVAVEVERQKGEDAWRALNDEQGALLRIATLVAEAAPPERLLRSVTTEAGLLYEGDTARTLRFEDGGHARVLGCWSNDEVLTVELGDVTELATDRAPAEVLRTNAAVRVDTPDEEGGAIAAPVVVEGRLWGAITVARTSARPFPAQAEWRLGRLAEIFALAIANLEAREQLAASRARIVEASDRERRRLERNLHDGAQQRLVTLALTLRLAQAQLAHDPPAAALVQEAAAELAGALEELRELARGIHPAALAHRGLVPAIELLISRTTSLTVQLETRLDERLPEAVEAGAYYVVAESLTNVAKYAGAAAAAVRLVQDGDVLRIEVEDDGAGGADAARGSGLSGLADRVEALGGRLDVRSPPGEGTLVRAEIPSRRRAG